jgi:Zinc-binding dehydrogenase/Alcohol dehydrogenase GroES-like domain
LIDAQMRAVRLHGPGDPASLIYERIPTPRPGPGEVLVRVHAAAITRNELDWPEDRLPATPSYEFSGVVAAVGARVERVEVGEAVYALSDFDRDGAAADYVLVRCEILAPKPRALDHLGSAAIPLAGLSAWQGLFDHGRLSEGERVLIHGAAGGVGAFAVQLARARGAQVLGTASAENVAAARELGADEVIDHSVSRFEDLVDPVDLVFDTVGRRATRALAGSPARGWQAGLDRDRPAFDRSAARDRRDLLRRRAEPRAVDRAREPCRRRRSAADHRQDIRSGRRQGSLRANTRAWPPREDSAPRRSGRGVAADPCSRRMKGDGLESLERSPRSSKRALAGEVGGNLEVSFG